MGLRRSRAPRRLAQRRRSLAPAGAADDTALRMLPPEDYGGQPRREALDVLERFTSDLVPKDPAVDVRTSVEEGKNPAKVLIERSKEADLLVVGYRGHGGFVGMLLGSVSQHLVGHAECPVVVVR